MELILDLGKTGSTLVSPLSLYNITYSSTSTVVMLFADVFFFPLFSLFKLFLWKWIPQHRGQQELVWSIQPVRVYRFSFVLVLVLYCMQCSSIMGLIWLNY